MQYNNIVALLFLLISASAGAAEAYQAPAGGKAISDHLIGIFFEDISHAADGGLNAELVQNGSFEYSPNERDGWGPGTAWKTVRHGHSLGYIQPVNSGFGSPTFMRLHTERVGHYYDYKGWTGFGIQNGGFDGISVKAGAAYDFSLRLRNHDGVKKQMRVVLTEPQGKGKPFTVLADDTVEISADAVWNAYNLHLVAGADSKHAALQLIMLNTGDVDIDDVSLLPEDTYKGHGLRKDLVEALAALHPKFMRFPGGCIIHGGGDGMWNTYRWKNTIGPKWARQGLKNCWGYHQSMALGYYEYFQLCEDLDMAPLPVLPCGVSCQGAGGGWNMKTQAQDAVPMEQMDEWVQDALDLIEWANGDPATSVWARKRAEAGHPEPFGLKYLGIGNEERISPEFIERFKYIYERVRAAHPEIVIVGTAGPGSHPGNRDFEKGWKLAEEIGLPILDEHYYEKHDYFLKSRQYDKYPRDRKTKVYLGEYAAKDKKLIDALAEALYLLHVERNGDVVCMTSYAPLFARKGATNWNPNLIYFDNERPYLTCSYYVQQMFGQSAGQYFYGDCVSVNGDGALQEQSVILNVKTRRLYVKLCNASGKSGKAAIDLSRFSPKGQALKTVFKGKPGDENNFEHQPVSPKTERVETGERFTLKMPPYSFTMLEYEL